MLKMFEWLTREFFFEIQPFLKVGFLSPLSGLSEKGLAKTEVFPFPLIFLGFQVVLRYEALKLNLVESPSVLVWVKMYACFVISANLAAY